MEWSLVTVATSERPVKCRICGSIMEAQERKARLVPDATDGRNFFYYHQECLRLEVGKAALLLGRVSPD